MSSGKNSKLSKRRKRSQQKLTMIKKVVIKDSNSDSDSDSNSINQYITPKNKNIVKPKVWELNNRKTFYNWLHKQYNKYDSANNQEITDETVKLFRVQKLLRDYMQDSSPYRGILLYHGLGSGKTCSAIAIASALEGKEEVIFMSNASLETNFIKAIRVDCGPDYMRKSSHWVFSECKTSAEKKLVKKLGIPDDIINENNGVFLIDYKESGDNFERLSSKNQLKLTNQLEATIRKRFKFLHLDDTGITKKIEEGIFDNKAIIIDEVHNLTNRMTGATKSGPFFYDLLMKSKNCKLIFLSGTPIINKVFELTRIYNILRGYIPTIVYKLIPEFGKQIQYSIIKNKLIQNINVDQVVVDKLRKTIKVSKNPDNFVRDSSKNGLIKDSSKSSDMNTFKETINKMMVNLKSVGGFSKMTDTIENNTCLPEDEKEFQKIFYSYESNKIKKVDVLRKRIVGLTSFYEKIDESKFPTIKAINIVPMEMSSYQLGKYQPYRSVEIEKQKNQMKRKGDDETLKSSYRLYSRLHCTFVFPDEIGSPYDKDNMETYAKLEEVLEEKEAKYIKDDEDVKSIKKSLKEGKNEFDKVEKLSKKFLAALEKESDKYMTFDLDDESDSSSADGSSVDSNSNNKLGTYSPKYVHIIRDIVKTIGCCFVYSQFIEMIGLNTFAIALKATGRFAKLELKKIDGQYMLDMSNYKDESEFRNKMKYIFYAGETKGELKEIYRQIYNSEFSQLPPNCRLLKRQLEDLYGDDQNLHGQVIKIFLTTRSGAEGVDLKHIRKIYIMEPYWQPVLIKQIIGRGKRYESHVRLPAEERNVEIFIYMASFSRDQVKNHISGVIRGDVGRYNVSTYQKKGKPITSDESLYITSQYKLAMIEQVEKIMKDSAFDCTLNYTDNIENVDNKNIVCLDYDSVNRDDSKSYLYAPNVEDTVDIVEYDQEDAIKISYQKVEIPKNSKKFYWRLAITPIGEKNYLYSGDRDPSKMSRMPKPVGEIIETDGKKKVLLFKKK